MITFLHLLSAVVFWGCVTSSTAFALPELDISTAGGGEIRFVRMSLSDDGLTIRGNIRRFHGHMGSHEAHIDVVLLDKNGSQLAETSERVRFPSRTRGSLSSTQKSFTLTFPSAVAKKASTVRIRFVPNIHASCRTK